MISYLCALWWATIFYQECFALTLGKAL